MIPLYLSLFVRGAVFLGFAAAGVIAGTHWAVKHGYLRPFGAFPSTVRRLSTPLIRPMKGRLLRSGGNPSSAPYFLFWGVVIGGLVTIALVEWVIRAIFTLAAGASAGPLGLLAVGVNAIFSILMIALFIRVISSWFGLSPYSRPMRIVYGLTSWLIEPLRRFLPPLGMFDLSPLVAYLMLMLARQFVLSLFY